MLLIKKYMLDFTLCPVSFFWCKTELVYHLPRDAEREDRKITRGKMMKF